MQREVLQENEALVESYSKSAQAKREWTKKVRENGGLLQGEVLQQNLAVMKTYRNNANQREAGRQLDSNNEKELLNELNSRREAGRQKECDNDTKLLDCK